MRPYKISCTPHATHYTVHIDKQHNTCKDIRWQHCRTSSRHTLQTPVRTPSAVTPLLLQHTTNRHMVNNRLPLSTVIRATSSTAAATAADGGPNASCYDNAPTQPRQWTHFLPL